MMRIRYQNGMTLLEVMISVFVLSVGLIGIAKLQVTSKQNNFDAVQRITATTLAYEIIERMRANATTLTEYVDTSGTRIIDKTSITSEPTPTCGNSDAVCSEVELAAHDLWEFKEALSGATEKNGNTNTGGLDEFTACISGPDTGAAGVYTVAIAWRGRIPLSNPTTNNCGATSGAYGEGNKYRRVLQFVTYIDNQEL
jgi:type IV pilus assembly protein PilV